MLGYEALMMGLVEGYKEYLREIVVRTVMQELIARPKAAVPDPGRS